MINRSSRTTGGPTSGDVATSLKELNRARRSALLHEMPMALRRLHVRVLSETMANGVPVNPAALVAVLAAHDESTGAALTFTAEQIEELLWYGVAEFCEEHEVVMPKGCREALHAVLAVGTETQAFDPASDSPAILFGALDQLVAR